jgi:polysaccharide export outer membrane protein
MRQMKLLVVSLLTVWLGACGSSSFGEMNLAGGALAPSPATTGFADGAPSTPSATIKPASLSGEGRKLAETFTASATQGSASYKIGPLDVLDVSVFKVPDLSKQLQVSEQGTINVALLGDVQVAGKTARDVERELAKQWGRKYLQNPQVTVGIKEYNSQRLTVEGAVKKAGVYPMVGSVSLLQSIAMAQGLDPTADTAVLVFRDSGGKRSVARFDLAEIRNGASADPQLQPGDVVVVNSSAIKEIFNNFVRVLPMTNAFIGLI